MNLEDIELPDPRDYDHAFLGPTGVGRWYVGLGAPLRSFRPYIIVFETADRDEAGRVRDALSARLRITRRLLGIA